MSQKVELEAEKEKLGKNASQGLGYNEESLNKLRELLNEEAGDA